VISDLVTPAGGADQRAHDGDAQRLTEQHRAAARRQADRDVIDALTGRKPAPGPREEKSLPRRAGAGPDETREAGRE
jgi:hypothetical protein